MSDQFRIDAYDVGPAPPLDLRKPQCACLWVKGCYCRPTEPAAATAESHVSDSECHPCDKPSCVKCNA